MFNQILLSLWVSFDTLYDTATNNICQISDHGMLWNIVFINWQILFHYIFLSHFPPASPEWVSLKPLILYNDISVNWRYQHHWFITITIIIILSLHTCLGRQICHSTSLNATGIRVLLNFRISFLFSITRTNSPYARFISFASFVFRHVDIVRKRMTSQKQFLR